MARLRLPAELLYYVFRRLDKDALTRLCRTDHTFGTIALHVLYESVYLSELPEIVGCCQAIVSNAAVARAVRKFRIAPQNPLENIVEQSCFFAFVRLIRRALHAIRYVRTLDIQLYSGQEQLLEGLTLPHLQILDAFALMPVTSITSKFLSLHPTITKLHLGLESDNPAHRPFTLSESDLPALHDFAGSPALVEAIAPGRPLSKCTILPHDLTPLRSVSVLDVCQALLLSSKTIENLRIDILGCEAIGSCLAAISQYLPQIEELSVYQIHDQHGKYNPTENCKYFELISEHIVKFENLKTLFVMETHFVEEEFELVMDADRIEDELTVVNTWANKCDKLQLVVMPSNFFWKPFKGLWLPQNTSASCQKWLYGTSKALREGQDTPFTLLALDIILHWQVEGIALKGAQDDLKSSLDDTLEEAPELKLVKKLKTTLALFLEELAYRKYI